MWQTHVQEDVGEREKGSQGREWFLNTVALDAALQPNPEALKRRTLGLNLLGTVFTRRRSAAPKIIGVPH
jgi:hypothetical protein